MTFLAYQAFLCDVQFILLWFLEFWLKKKKPHSKPKSFKTQYFLNHQQESTNMYVLVRLSAGEYNSLGTIHIKLQSSLLLSRLSANSYYINLHSLCNIIEQEINV